MRNRKVLLATTLIAVLAVVIGVANIGGAGAEPDGIGRWGRSGHGSSSAAARSPEPSAAEVQAAAARSLTFIEEETQNFAFVDVGPRDESVGDSFIFRDRLLDPRTNAHVGSLSVQCTLAFFSTESPARPSCSIVARSPSRATCQVRVAASPSPSPAGPVSFAPREARCS